MDRSRLARWAAPVAFLAAITIGVLVVRAGLQHGQKHHAQQPTTTVSSKGKKKHGHSRRHVRRYTIQSGDTFASIASKTGTTVARLEQLNPGIDPTALRVGETIRVQ
ncbi:MAG: LysM peptidoglycan-binding domain-containing protein [Gaiellaceae bacterium]